MLAVEVSTIKPEKLDQAEAALLSIRRLLDGGGGEGGRGEEIRKLSDEFYSAVPHHKKHRSEITSKRDIAQKQDFCQVS